MIKVCTWCCKQFKPSKWHPKQMLCSSTCNVRNTKAGLGHNLPKQCESCGDIFITRIATKQYCSTRCQTSTWAKDNAEHKNAYSRGWKKTPKGKATNTKYIHKRRARKLGNESHPNAALFELKPYCDYCSTEEGPFERDHIQPLSRGGAHALHNLATACAPCNRSKGSKLVSEWTPKEVHFGN